MPRDMMRLMATLVFLGAAAMLGGCQTKPDGTKVIDPAIVDTAQNIAVTVCGFLPLANTIAAIVATGNPLVLTGEAIGQAICAAEVKTASAARAGAAAPAPVVAGVVVQGRFIK